MALHLPEKVASCVQQFRIVFVRLNGCVQNADGLPVAVLLFMNVRTQKRQKCFFIGGCGRKGMQLLRGQRVFFLLNEPFNALQLRLGPGSGRCNAGDPFFCLVRVVAKIGHAREHQIDLRIHFFGFLQIAAIVLPFG